MVFHQAWASQVIPHNWSCFPILWLQENKGARRSNIFTELVQCFVSVNCQLLEHQVVKAQKIVGLCLKFESKYHFTSDSMSDGKVWACTGLIRILAKVVFQPRTDGWNRWRTNKQKRWILWRTWHRQLLILRPCYDYIWVWNLLSIQLNVGDLAFAAKFHREHIFVPATFARTSTI